MGYITRAQGPQAEGKSNINHTARKVVPVV